QDFLNILNIHPSPDAYTAQTECPSIPDRDPADNVAGYLHPKVGKHGLISPLQVTKFTLMQDANALFFSHVFYTQNIGRKICCTSQKTFQVVPERFADKAIG
ncbi:MAG: hypothetical protein IRZ29_08515, partial [Thermoflavifilum sp.]|nr:hypothetical protein [Thermoflavifilum sp.]